MCYSEGMVLIADKICHLTHSALFLYVVLISSLIIVLFWGFILTWSSVLIPVLALSIMCCFEFCREETLTCCGMTNKLILPLSNCNKPGYAIQISRVKKRKKQAPIMVVQLKLHKRAYLSVEWETHASHSFLSLLFQALNFKVLPTVLMWVLIFNCMLFWSSCLDKTSPTGLDVQFCIL